MSERRRERIHYSADLGGGTTVELSPESGGSLAQEGAVRMESVHHEAGVELVVTGREGGSHPLYRKRPSEQARGAWRNEIGAPENGRAGAAILRAHRMFGYVVTSQSRHGLRPLL